MSFIRKLLESKGERALSEVEVKGWPADLRALPMGFAGLVGISSASVAIAGVWLKEPANSDAAIDADEDSNDRLVG